jgi:hypothetical protein
MFLSCHNGSDSFQLLGELYTDDVLYSGDSMLLMSTVIGFLVVVADDHDPSINVIDS